MLEVRLKAYNKSQGTAVDFRMGYDGCSTTPIFETVAVLLFWNREMNESTILGLGFHFVDFQDLIQLGDFQNFANIRGGIIDLNFHILLS